VRTDADPLSPGHTPPAARCDTYRARLPSLRAAHAGVLSESEQHRSEQFRTPADRDRFVLGAALLRISAGERLGVEPSALIVDRACDDCGRPHGKPRLPGTGLHVSVSHSGDIALVSLTTAGPVGVDVEAVRPIDLGAVAGYTCTAAEQQHVTGLAAFFTYWTRKEAVLKATGEGLRRPMTDVFVAPPEAPPALLGLAGGAPPPCQLADLPAGPGYLAAVAVLTAAPIDFELLDADLLLASARSASGGRPPAAPRSASSGGRPPAAPRSIE
jgi:4'-phosphopantetheinyl transferase